MRSKIFTIVRMLSLITGFLLLFQYSKCQIVKVNLLPGMVTNESSYGNPATLVDEQVLSGDPLNSPTTHPTTIWSTPYGKPYPMSARIDLGVEMNLVNIFIYDSYNVGELKIEYGSPGNWQTLLTDPMTLFKKWKNRPVNVTTRYLRLVKANANVNLNEIVIYANNPVQLPPLVSNLAVSEPTPFSIKLSWNDVAGNSATGQFLSYDIRYSNEPINDANFNLANQYPCNLIPSAGGQKELTVFGLDEKTKYYFALKLAGQIANSLMSNVVSQSTTFVLNYSINKINVSPSMVVNESGFGDAGMMVDESGISGDVISGIGGTPQSAWYPGNSSGSYPASAFIDFGTEISLVKIYIYNLVSAGDLIVEYGNPGNWNFLLTDPLTDFQIWLLHDVGVNTRYLRFTKTSPESNFAEVVFYGLGEKLEESKITLDVEMIENVSGYGEPWKLMDEQVIAGDPANGTGGNPTTFWQTGFQSHIPYPLYAKVDLGKIHYLSKIFIRDAMDYGNFAIYGGYAENWDLITVDNLTGYLSWNQHDTQVLTRYLLLEKFSAKSNVSEMVLYGNEIMPGIFDTIAPATINLTATQQGCCSVTLDWTAPGDDEMLGNASKYMIKYSQDPITFENFHNLTSVPYIPEPLPSGTLQTIEVQNLSPETLYYFAIMALDDAQNFSAISNIATATTSYQIGGLAYRFALRPDMILNESVQGNATLLVDEQGISGNPKEGNGGNPQNKWEVGSTLWKYPAFAMVDLQGMCLLSDIFLYDVSDSGEDSISPVSLYYGEPFNWQPLFVDSLKNTNSWNRHQIAIETRYLRIQIHSPETRISEILVYGTRLETPLAEPIEQTHPLPTMHELIGANVLITAPLGKMKAVGFVREYHNWMWCEGNNSTTYPGYPNNQNEFLTLGWNFDVFYKNLNNSNITASPVIQNNVPWLTGFDYSKLSHKPVKSGFDPLLPSSYIEHADHLFQYVARYGSVESSDSLLKLAAGQPRITGANSLKYIENWNEQDRWWNSRDAFFTPYEYAAMASADYDGHFSTMGTSVGVKNADPDVKLVMGGVAKPDINYVKALKLWADYHRNGSLPVDVINVHHYCNDGADQSSGSVGISPEADNLKGLMKEFVRYRNQYLPGKEVWITEFGYDTHPESVQRAPAIGSFNQEEVQAQWIVRSYLALAAAGVDKAAMFMLSDVNPLDKTKFQTSGLICVPDSGYRSKPSWYYVYTLKNRLGSMIFDQEIQSGNPNVLIYKFKHPEQPGFAAYAVWCPTSNQTTVQNYILNLTYDEQKAVLVELENGKTNGSESTLFINNQSVVFNVSERPVFVMVAGSDFLFPQLREEVKLTLNPAMLVNESGYGQPSMLVDEQSITGDPIMGLGGEPQTAWSAGFSNPHPCSAYIDLGAEYDITSLYLRDMHNVGDITFSTGEPGNWIPEFVEECKLYKAWTGHVINKKTRYIRVTKHSPTSSISEIVVYIKE